MAFTGLDPETQERLFGETPETTPTEPPVIPPVETPPTPPPVVTPPPVEPPKIERQAEPQPTAGDIADLLLDAGEAKAQIRNDLRNGFTKEAVSDEEVDAIMNQVATVCKGNPSAYREILNGGGHIKFAHSIVGEKVVKGQIRSEQVQHRERTVVSGGSGVEHAGGGPSIAKQAGSAFRNPALEEWLNKNKVTG